MGVHRYPAKNLKYFSMITIKKGLVITIVLFVAVDAFAQLPVLSPRRAASHARSAAREGKDVVESVNDINELVNGISAARKTIDSLVANDKSKTPGEVRLLFTGVQLNDETLTTVEESLKKLDGVSEVNKVAKSGSIAIQMKSELYPFNIWKKMPKSVQKSYLVHDKDAYNVVLLYKIPPPKPK